MDRKHILVIDGLRPAHKILKSYGVELTLFTETWRVKTQDSSIYDRIISFNNNEDAQWVKMAQYINSVAPINGIAAYHERHQKTAALIGEALGIETNKLSTIELVYDKYLMRKKLIDAGLETASCKICGNKQDIVDFASENGFPFIVKPLSGWASIGVSKISSFDDIESAVKWFEKWYDSNCVMYAETFFEGREFSVEGVSCNGAHKFICVTEKFKEESHFVEVGHCVPAKISSEEEMILKEHVERMLNLFGVSSGPTHTEIMLTDQGPHIIETHTRMGGDMIPDLVKFALDIDMMDLTVRLTLGENVLTTLPKEIEAKQHACIWYKMPRQSGKIAQLYQKTDTEKLVNCKELVFLQNEGDVIEAVHDSFSRTAYAICTGDTFDEAVNNSIQAVKDIVCVIKDGCLT